MRPVSHTGIQAPIILLQSRLCSQVGRPSTSCSLAGKLTPPSLAFVPGSEGLWHSSRHLFKAEQGHVSRAGWHRTGREGGGKGGMGRAAPRWAHLSSVMTVVLQLLDTG